MNGDTTTATFELSVGRKSRGKFPVSVVQSGQVLAAAEINPHKPEEIDTFVDDMAAICPTISTDNLRAQILQLAAPTDQGSAGEENDAEKYFASEDGLMWRKGSREGTIAVPLTNFTARIATEVVRDDGQEQHRVFEIVAEREGQEYNFTIPAEQFTGMNWPIEHMGPGAIVYAGIAIRDNARVAIQKMSAEYEHRVVFAHTGWRQINNKWVYLHAGGAIGADGPVAGIEVDVGDALANYILPDPPTGEELVHCVLDCLDMMFVGPFAVTLPVLCGIFRAPLNMCDSSLFLTGPTGACKSEIAALASQFFGAGLDRRHLPASWAGTDNALEGLAFAAKDTMLVIDDFAPAGTQFDVQRMHQKADRVLRAAGNHSGRQRMWADGNLRPTKSPRGFIMSTGEDIPRGVSLRARIFVIELGPDDINLDVLTICQAHASAGKYARAMAGYVRWLAARMTEIKSEMPSQISEYRMAATNSELHARTPEAVANLFFGYGMFLDFAVDIGAINDKERQSFQNCCWHVLGQAAQKQAGLQRAAEPAQRFLDLLASAFTSGNACVVKRDGARPSEPAPWGWKRDSKGEWHSTGDRVGWIDEAEGRIFLDCDSSYRAAQAMADRGDGLAISARTLLRRLNEKGLLRREPGRDELTTRRVVEGSTRKVVDLPSDAILDVPAPIEPTNAEGEVIPSHP
jgi:hypothetical protein